MTIQEIRTELTKMGFKWEPYKTGSLWKLDSDYQCYIVYIFDKESNNYFIETSLSIEINSNRDRILENAKFILEAYNNR